MKHISNILKVREYPIITYILITTVTNHMNIPFKDEIISET